MKRLFLIMLLILFVSPMVCQAAQPGFMKYRMGTMEGQVFFDGDPVSNAMLAFFKENKGLPPIAGGGGRMPESLGRTNHEGRFKVKLIQGSYYLGILLRPAGEPPGPPRKGEVFYFADAGQGRLRTLKIKNYKQVNVGRVDASLPEVFHETEDHFTVEGTVYKEEGDEPFEGAVVMGKTTAAMQRPQYVSARTGKDGKFSIKLPPDRTFYLVARKTITGVKPAVGESIGKYGADSYLESSSITAQAIGSPPPGVAKKETPRIIADSIPVSGSKDEVISGLKIVMYKMPDQNKLRAENMRSADAPDYETGYAMSNLFFATTSHELDERSFDELDLWVGYFKGRRDIAIKLIGHTDNIGSEEHNLQLSRKRAESVARYLVSKGISPGRISVQGSGSTSPVASNDTEEGRNRNRRVDIKFDK
jgi:outer membrane protein OmpA-like peptidoglycan-associated protein